MEINETLNVIGYLKENKMLKQLALIAAFIIAMYQIKKFIDGVLGKQ